MYHLQPTYSQMTTMSPQPSPSEPATSDRPSRYESQKRRDWATFGLYLRNHRPPLTLSRCSAAHVLEFLRYLDQFGKTKVHFISCPYFGHPHPPMPCQCPLKQAWGSLDALVGRLRAAFEENGGLPEVNPFGVRAVRLYLRGVRDTQARARGIAYEKKKKKRRQRGTKAASINGGGEEKMAEENGSMGGGQSGNFTLDIVGEGYGAVGGYQDVFGMFDGFIPLSVFN